MFQGVITVKSDGSKWKCNAINASRAWDSICFSRVRGSVGDSVSVTTLGHQGQVLSHRHIATVRKI